MKLNHVRDWKNFLFYSVMNKYIKKSKSWWNEKACSAFHKPTYSSIIAPRGIKKEMFYIFIFLHFSQVIRKTKCMTSCQFFISWTPQTHTYMKLETAQLETAATRNHFERKTNHQFLRLSALSPLAEQQVCVDANYEPAGHP